MIQSKNGDLIIVGGYDYESGSLFDSMQRLVCSRENEFDNPYCEWQEMAESLEVAREGNVAILIENNFCKLSFFF